MAYSLPAQLILTEELSKVELSELRVVTGILSVEKSLSKSSTVSSSQDRKIIAKNKAKLFFK